MKRRNFIQLSSLFTTGAIALPGQVLSAFNNSPLLDRLNFDNTNDRIMVIIQLKGGNDGLNTVIPLGRFDTYAKLRPDIYIPKNKGIFLDSNLSSDAEVALHPSLTDFKHLYDQGKLSIIQEVGYPNHNRSHFKSTDIWLSGGDGKQHKQLTNGWMARYLENAFEINSYLDPLGIQLGNKAPSLGFHTEEEHTLSINLSGQDPAGFFSLVSSIGAQVPDFDPTSDFGKIIQHITQVEKGVDNYAKRISEVFNKGKNSATYPDTSLANQLKTVAKLISGGSKTKIFLANHGGFDTHNQQVVGNDKTKGKHATLLNQLSEAVMAFQNDIEQLGLADKIVTFTFSEFGRKISQNGNLGTDHGNFAPLFVIGKNITSGVIGTNPNIDDLGKNDQLKTMQHDYRDVFSNLLRDWMGASDTVINKTFMTDITPKKFSLINTPVEKTEIKIYPNPSSKELKIKTENLPKDKVVLEILSVKGKSIHQKELTIGAENNISIDISSLKQGIYFSRLTTKDRKVLTQKKFIKN